MAFKNVDEFKAEKYGGKFILPNDQDFADVIFLYQSTKDVLVADTHYIKSADYSGYVHCTEIGCPCCAKGIRKQTKLFIPVYNISKGEIQFWDRTMKFEPQLHTDVFSRFPNPSEFVFRITRVGVSGDINTKYNIVAIGNNTYKSYNQILSENTVLFPDYYNHVCRDVDSSTLLGWLNTSNGGNNGYNGAMPDYTPTPRVVVNDVPTIAKAVHVDLVESDEELDEDVDFG